MKKPKVEVIKLERNAPCGCCNVLAKGNPKYRKGCPRCASSGNYKHYHYIMIVGKQAFDTDTIK